MKAEELLLWEVILISGDSENGFKRISHARTQNRHRCPSLRRRRRARITQFREFGNNGPVSLV